MVFEDIEEEGNGCCTPTEELEARKCKDLNSYGHGQHNEPFEFKDGGNGYRRGSPPGFSYKPDPVSPVTSSL